MKKYLLIVLTLALLLTPVSAYAVGRTWNQSDTSPVLSACIDANGNSIICPDFNATLPWSGMGRVNTTTTDNQTMVVIPAFWYKTVNWTTGGYHYMNWTISDTNISGFTLHPAFVSNNTQYSKIYIGAFEASVFDVTAEATEINTIQVTAEPTANGNMTITLDGNYAFTVAILNTDSIEGVVDKIVAAGVKTDYQGVTWTPAKTASDTLTYTAGSSGLKTVVTMPTANGVTSTITKTVTGTGGYVKNDAGAVDFTATSGDKIASIAGVKPASGWENTLTIVNARKLAVNRGVGWGLLNFNQASAIHMLYAIEYANLNSQSALSAGITQITDDSTTNMGVNTGFTAGVGAGSSDLGNASGQVTNTHYATSQTCYPMSYRGIENIYGNVWKWIDGINIKADRNPWIADNGFVSDQFSAPYVDSGLTLPSSIGYASNLAYGAGLDYGFLPSAVDGSSSTYLADYYYQAAGNRVALLGGDWTDGATAGAFHWYLHYAALVSYRSMGVRAVFLSSGDTAVTPVAAFTKSRSIVRIPQTVTFTDTSTNTPTSWGWYANNTLLVTTQNWSNVAISNVGVTDIALYAENAAGGDWANDTVTVEDGVSAFTSSATTGVPGAIITFTNTSTNLASEWKWYCYDNETESSNTEVSSCAFATVGDYSIRLNASNGVTYDWENKTNYITIANATPSLGSTYGWSLTGITAAIVGALTLIGVMLIGGGTMMIIRMFRSGTMGREGSDATSPSSMGVGVAAMAVGALLLFVAYIIISPLFTLAGV